VTSVTDARSASARLLAGMWRPLVSVITTLYYVAIIFHRRVALSLHCVYSRFGHHPHPLGYLCAKFRFFRDLHCCARPWRKLCTQSLTQLIWCPGNRSASELRLCQLQDTAHEK